MSKERRSSIVLPDLVELTLQVEGIVRKAQTLISEDPLGKFYYPPTQDIVDKVHKLIKDLKSEAAEQAEEVAASQSPPSKPSTEDVHQFDNQNDASDLLHTDMAHSSTHIDRKRVTLQQSHSKNSLDDGDSFIEKVDLRKSTTTMNEEEEASAASTSTISSTTTSNKTSTESSEVAVDKQLSYMTIKTYDSSIVDVAPEPNVEWPTIEDFDLGEALGLVRQYVSTWQLSPATLFSIAPFEIEKDLPMRGKRYYCNVLFSKPTPRNPNPLAVAKAHFYIHVPQLLPKWWQINVLYRFEGYKTLYFATGRRRAQSLDFQRYFIDNILYFKLMFYIKLYACRHPIPQTPESTPRPMSEDECCDVEVTSNEASSKDKDYCKNPKKEVPQNNCPASSSNLNLSPAQAFLENLKEKVAKNYPLQ